MDFKQLETFYRLSSVLSFTKTADELGYTQSCVTQQIKKLEEELGAPLFDRIGKKITLTEVGRRMIPLTLQILKMTQNFHRLSAEDVNDTRTLRIGVCDSLCIERMPAIVKAFRKNHGNVEIYLRILKCSEFLNELRENKIDLAYTIGYLNKIPEINYTGEAVEPIYVLASPDHPLASKKNLTPKDFSGVPLILTEPAAYYRRNFLNDLQCSGIEPKIVLETESIQAIKNLAASGLGVCILPKAAASGEMNDGKLVCLDYPCDYDIRSQLIWHRDKWLSPLMKDFIRTACQVIAAEL